MHRLEEGLVRILLEGALQVVLDQFHVLGPGGVRAEAGPVGVEPVRQGETVDATGGLVDQGIVDVGFQISEALVADGSGEASNGRVADADGPGHLHGGTHAYPFGVVDEVFGDLPLRLCQGCAFDPFRNNTPHDCLQPVDRPMIS